MVTFTSVPGKRRNGQSSGLIAGAKQKSRYARQRATNDLIIRKNTWKTLHTYIKPATDAHTLNLPISLLELATDHIRRIPNMERTEIVVLLTPELMYYQNTPQLRLPEHLVFLEIPYSQGPGFFTNLAIYHELGHYVFDQLSDSPKQSPSFKLLTESLEAAFEAAFNEKLGTQITTPSKIMAAKTVLDRWTQEIFCDLFAVRHIGPAFSFALIDILSLLGLMTADTETTFTSHHPATAIRFNLKTAVGRPF